MATETKRKGKKIVTPAVKRDIEKARRDLAAGKGISVGELLNKVLERDARKTIRSELVTVQGETIQGRGHVLSED